MFSLRRLAPQHLLPLLRPRQKSPRRALSLQFRTISTVSKLGRFGMGRVCKSSHESCAFADSSSGQLRRKITTATAVLADGKRQSTLLAEIALRYELTTTDTTGLAKDSPTKLASDSEEDAFLPEDESLQTNSNASGRSFIYVAIDGDDCWVGAASLFARNSTKLTILAHSSIQVWCKKDVKGDGKQRSGYLAIFGTVSR